MKIGSEICCRQRAPRGYIGEEERKGAQLAFRLGPRSRGGELKITVPPVGFLSLSLSRLFAAAVLRQVFQQLRLRRRLFSRGPPSPPFRRAAIKLGIVFSFCLHFRPADDESRDRVSLPGPFCIPLPSTSSLGCPCRYQTFQRRCTGMWENYPLERVTYLPLFGYNQITLLCSELPQLCAHLLEESLL